MLPARCKLPALLAGYGAAAPALEVSGIEMDSRRVSPGDLFLACRGSGPRHGLNYLEQALENGAAAVAWEPAAGVAAPEADVPVIAVEGLSRRAGEIAARFFGEPGKHLFTTGVTGTDGKTSTAYLIAQTLERLGAPCAYVGTLGHGRVGHLSAGTHTTPDAVSLQRQLAHLREQGVVAAALEVSSHALDQDRVAGLAFDVAILTNLTRDHLDYHGTLENYAAAKKRLFTRYRRGEAVLNRDDATGRRWADELLDGGDGQVTVTGIDGEVPGRGRHVIARGLRLHGAGQSFTVESSWGTAQLESRLLGRFNCYNLCSTLAALLVRGTPLAAAVAALAQATTVPGRIEGFRGPKARPLVVVDYAHTPEALGQILQSVRAHTERRLWCVFGCGGDRDRGKRPLMAAAAARHADQVIITDDNPRSESPQAIVAEIRAGLPEGYLARVIHDRAEAIGVAVHGADEGDVVVVAGKGHETTQTYGTEVREFSDRAYVAQLVGAPQS
jgi:UDP-N-acetylmuramoyl-L-alanyl-D-glutamate--2,6-diaminopimelate ligase